MSLVQEERKTYCVIMDLISSKFMTCAGVDAMKLGRISSKLCHVYAIWQPQSRIGSATACTSGQYPFTFFINMKTQELFCEGCTFYIICKLISAAYCVKYASILFITVWYAGYLSVWGILVYSAGFHSVWGILVYCRQCDLKVSIVYEVY